MKLVETVSLPAGTPAIIASPKVVGLCLQANHGGFFCCGHSVSLAEIEKGLVIVSYLISYADQPHRHTPGIAAALPSNYLDKGQSYLVRQRGRGD